MPTYRTMNRVLIGCAGLSLIGVPVAQAAGHSGLSAPSALSRDNAASLIKVADNGKKETVQGARNFIDNLASRALSFLRDEDLSQDQLRHKFRVLLNESFDINTLARFALGRYWRTANEQQRATYLELFEKMVIEVYSKRFSDYEGQRFVIEKARMASNTDAIVTSRILPPKGEDGQTIKIDWRVRYKNSAYQIVDVIVEGVSMSLTKRSDFSAVIQRGGGDIAVLLAHLRERYAAGESGQPDVPRPSQKTSAE